MQIKNREKAVQKLEQLGTSADYMALLKEALNRSNELALIEKEAISKVEKKQYEDARKLIFGDKYEKVKAEIMGDVIGFISLVEKKSEQETQSGMEQLSEQDGDLTQRIDYDGQDEIGLMVSGFHMFIQKVQNIVQAAAEVSKELQAENIVFRNSVEKVVSSSERVAVTMEEHNSSTIVISDKNNEMSTYVDRLCQNINLFKYC